MPSDVHPVDQVPPPGRLLLFAIQHVLVMAASPITAVFLIGRALHLPPALAAGLVSATFLACGLGTLLQSFGPWGIGARLPFIMVPAGAPVFIFVGIAEHSGIPTASGAVILTAVFYLIALPVYARCLRYFSRLVIGTILLLVGINLVRIYGSVITGAPGSPQFGAPSSLLLALATIGFTVAFARLLPGLLRQLSVLLGLLAGAVAAGLAGMVSLDGIAAQPWLTLPAAFPFGAPSFDVVAALPMLIFSVVSMTEATGQTVAIAEVVGKPIVPTREVPRTIRGDAVTSLFGACFGTPLIITSGENIGVVRATGIRSRFVTATGGAILVLLALLAPIGRLVNAIPAPVVGGTALVVFCVIAVMGIEMLRTVDVTAHGNLFTLAAGLAVGLLPVLIPNAYVRFPSLVQAILGNGLAAGTVVTVLLNIVFNHTGAAARSAATAEPERSPT
ncbi:uracil-xanthine permease family protein [Rhodopila sp.]|uniref:uracil-xanthine permease family protein n=1 Tax=Rhodopila sp. TaxID=2480087 RepID=UPI003D0A9497